MLERKEYAMQSVAMDLNRLPEFACRLCFIHV